MTRMTVMFGALAVAMMTATGCAGIEQPRTTPLDGQVFRVSVASDRGGVPDTIEMTFANGTLESSDALREGAVPAAYVVKTESTQPKASFEAETRAPGAVRRFRGTVDGARIEGDLEVSRDGCPPARYTFRGEAI